MLWYVSVFYITFYDIHVSLNNRHLLLPKLCCARKHSRVVMRTTDHQAFLKSNAGAAHDLATLSLSQDGLADTQT